MNIQISKHVRCSQRTHGRLTAFSTSEGGANKLSSASRRGEKRAREEREHWGKGGGMSVSTVCYIYMDEIIKEFISKEWFLNFPSDRTVSEHVVTSLPGKWDT